MEAFEADLAAATNADGGHLLGAVAMVIDAQGNMLYRRAAGRQLLDESSPALDEDCTVSLTSAGKFFTNIAALQLVERDLLTLDEPIKKYLPEVEKCSLIEQIEVPGDKEGEKQKKLVTRRPSRDFTLRDLLINISGVGYCESYKKWFGIENADDIPPMGFSDDAHYLAKDMFTHLFYEPGEGFDFAFTIYYVQLLVERLGDKDSFVKYMDEHFFKALGTTASTYLPAHRPHVWDRRLQMVDRVDVSETDDGKPQPCFEAADDQTRGVTCSMSDIAKIFSDIMSPDSKLLRRQEHRDMLFQPQLTPGSKAHDMFLADVMNYGFLMPLDETVDCTETWALSPPPKVNWTVAGALIEEDDALPGTGVPKGTVTWEGLPNVIWSMNREKGRMMFFGNQLLPSYDVKAHNLVCRFMRDAWKTFG